MKIVNKIIATLSLCSLVALSGCNKFLDTMPDMRAELDEEHKVTQILVAAYPTLFPLGILEHRTDNVDDNGDAYPLPDIFIQENYHWKGNTEPDWDTTQRLWQMCYLAISNANQALEAIEELGGATTPRLKAAKAEALMCRAYSHFILVNVFSQAYNGQTSDSDLGIPYSTEPETEIGVKHERPSVKENYEQMEKDILEALPEISEDFYSVPMYHFNKRAALAFATQFYLYYEKWDKAEKYATEVLGTNIAPTLRNISEYAKKYTNTKEWTYGYHSAKEPANLMIVATRSRWGRRYTDRRYAHTGQIASKQTLRSPGPWGSQLVDYDVLYYRGNPSHMVWLPKYQEIFEYTDAVAGIGQPHVVVFPFTTDKTLLLRAEARVMLEKYDDAASDLSMWSQSKGGNGATTSDIKSYYKGLMEDPEEVSPVTKPLHPKFELKEGDQTYMMQAVLHAKRILSVHSGERWDDIKRYGIEITHNLFQENPITLKSDDPRKALPIPAPVVAAGLTPNPSNNL